MAHRYYSQRMGTNPNANGLPLNEVIDLFVRIFIQLREDGFFDEAFGFSCVDAGDINGSVKDVELEMLLAIRKKSLWPIEETAKSYTEDDLFDVIEFLFQHVSKPIEGTYHSWNDCGMHWETFNKIEGQTEFRKKINVVLGHYLKPFELSENGEILHKPEAGFEKIFEADIPCADTNVTSRISAAMLSYRRHGSTIDDRRQAVRDLADVLEYLRSQVKPILKSADEKDLFQIANQFGIRHHNEQQRTDYDAALWLSWMFYFYLATIHVLLRKLQHENKAS